MILPNKNIWVNEWEALKMPLSAKHCAKYWARVHTADCDMASGDSRWERVRSKADEEEDKNLTNKEVHIFHGSVLNFLEKSKPHELEAALNCSPSRGSIPHSYHPRSLASSAVGAGSGLGEYATV